MRLRRDKGLEQPVGNFWRDARTGIGDADLNHAIFDQIGRYSQLPPPAPLHGLDRVSGQIDDDLLNLDLVHRHFGQPRVAAQLNIDVAFLGADQRERARLLDDLSEILGARLALVFSNEIAQPLNDLRRPRDLLQGVVDDVCSSFE